MIVIYTQDNTLIKASADDAKADLISLYGKKLGEEAYNVVKRGIDGISYRKYGGPLVRVVGKKKISVIKSKEAQIGMLKD